MNWKKVEEIVTFILSIFAVILGSLILTGVLTIKPGYLPFAPMTTGWILVVIGILSGVLIVIVAKRRKK